MLKVKHKSEKLANVRSLLVVPLIVYPDREGQILKDPFVDSVFSRGPCPKESGYILYRILEDGLEDIPNLKLLRLQDPIRVQSLIWAQADKDKEGGFEETFRRFLLKSVQEMGAEAVISGVVYRYKERVGEAFGAEEPASIAFSVFMLENQGNVLFAGVVDKTQKELLGNITDVGYYVKGGLTWWPVERLGRFGMDEVVHAIRSSRAS